MTTFQFQTHVSDSGVITLPMSAQTLYGKDVVLNVDADNANRTSSDEDAERLKHERRMGKRKATPDELQQFMNVCYGCLEGLSDREFEQLKMERILGK